VKQLRKVSGKVVRGSFGVVFKLRFGRGYFTAETGGGSLKSRARV